MAAKACESEPPRAWSPSRPASDTRKAIKAYSIAVAPELSTKKDRRSAVNCLLAASNMINEILIKNYQFVNKKLQNG